MIHPSSIDLEALACGESVPHAAEHVEGCEACRAFIGRARELAAKPARLPLERALAESPRRVLPMRRVLSLAAPLLAAAAAVVLFVRSSETPRDAPADPPATGVTVYAPGRTAEPETRFKGGVQIAVFRQRGTVQERFVDRLSVRPGDRLRVEVALDRTQRILAAVLGDDGSYLELMSDAARDAGTHFSERSAEVDAHPLSGTILVGSADAIHRARATRDLSGVTTMRVTWESP